MFFFFLLVAVRVEFVEIAPDCEVLVHEVLVLLVQDEVLPTVVEYSGVFEVHLQFGQFVALVFGE